MRHDELIERLGGVAEVARRLEMDPVTVWRWTSSGSTGIPIKHWPAIQRMAASLGLGVSDEELKLGIPYTGGRWQQELSPEQVS